MKKNIANLNVQGQVVLQMDGGDLVARGTPGRETGHLVGAARVAEQGEGVTRLEAEDDVVLSLPASTELTLSGNVGDVVLNGLARVTMEQCEGDLAASEIGALAIGGSVEGDAVLRHIGSDVTIAGVEGDLAIHHAGAVLLRSVEGDAAFHHVGEVRVDQVEGDLSISHAAAVLLRRVEGDVSLSNIAGDIVLDQVEGDLTVVAPGGSLTVREVEGDVHLSGGFQPGSETMLRAQGDVTLDITGNALLTLRAGGERVFEKELAPVGEDEAGDTFLLGEREGAAHVTIEAEGDIVVVDEAHHRRHRSRSFHVEGDWEVDLGEGRRWSGRHRSHGDPADVEQEVRRAMAEAREEIRRAKETVQVEVERALREVERAGPVGVGVGKVISSSLRELAAALRPVPPAPPTAPTPPAPPAAPTAPTEELQMVLRMVEQGTLSPEEAERLIAAMV